MLCSISSTVASLAIVADQLAEIGDLGVGETLRRLVEDQQLRLQRQAHRDFEQPLVAVGEFAGLRVRALGETDALERRQRTRGGTRRRIARAAAAALRCAGERDIVEGGQVREDAGDLERVGDAAPDPAMRRQAR